jgi:glycine/D-amino acid oxidase-like deaminating enzyme
MAAATSVIVVGAGIIGTAIAYEATRAGARVTLIDRGSISELGASRFGFGGVTWSTATTPATIEFSRRGFARYQGMEGVPQGCGWHV